jgi:hypothetical protein
VVAVTLMSSSTVREALLTSTPIATSWTTVRSTRVVQRPSSATAGWSVEEMSQSSTDPWASPLARIPLARASRTVQPRTVTRPRSPMTTPDVPRCSTVQDSSELSTAEVTTTPAPAPLLIRQSRMASEPVSRARTAAHAEPVTSQPSIAAWPRTASTTGRSSSRPRSTRSVSITASARRLTALPRRGRISTVPRDCSATMVTRVPTTRFSS